MGRFSSILLVLVAACGDNTDDSVGYGDPPVDEVQPHGNATAIPHYIPMVCSTQSWSTNIAGTAAMNVSVAARPAGAYVLAAPRDGGQLTGFVVDARMTMKSVNKVAVDGVFTQVTASYRQEKVNATAISDGNVFNFVLDEKLANPVQTGKVPGRFIAEPAFFNAQGDQVMPVAGDDGLWLHRYDDQFNLVESKLVLATDPARSLAAAQLGVATVTAMSTDTQCHIMVTSTFGKGLTTTIAEPCLDPRISVNPTTGSAVMLYDSPEGTRIMSIQQSQLGGDGRILREGSYAPRILNDGKNTWISYLDARGDIIVGFLDTQRNLTAMSLAGPKPERGAYELVMVEGEPWIFALGADGYAAYKMCVVAQD